MKDNDTIEVPLSILMNNFKNSVVNAVNTAHLPLYLTESILKDVLKVVSEGAKNQLEEERQKYEKMMKEQSEKESDEDELHKNTVGE